MYCNLRSNLQSYRPNMHKALLFASTQVFTNRQINYRYSYKRYQNNPYRGPSQKLYSESTPPLRLGVDQNSTKQIHLRHLVPIIPLFTFFKGVINSSTLNSRDAVLFFKVCQFRVRFLGTQQHRITISCCKKNLIAIFILSRTALGPPPVSRCQWFICLLGAVSPIRSVSDIHLTIITNLSRGKHPKIS